MAGNIFGYACKEVFLDGMKLLIRNPLGKSYFMEKSVGLKYFRLRVPSLPINTSVTPSVYRTL